MTLLPVIKRKEEYIEPQVNDAKEQSPVYQTPDTGY